MEKTMMRSVFSTGLPALFVAQFFSALADNAILIAAIAIVKSLGAEGLIPLLQGAFVVPFLLLAPFAGQIADAFPKGRVMLFANILKLTGSLLMLAGVNPLAAYGVIGVGATVYSPAKYGILSQMLAPSALVKANGALEGSTIAAILLGVTLGGFMADRSLDLAFSVVVAAYAIATVANFFIPRLDPAKPGTRFDPAGFFSDFFTSLKTLFSDPDARFSLFGTSVFWGSGITLRLLLFAWVPAALSIADNRTPANLMGIVSVGIVVGAALAGAFVPLEKASRALVGGLSLGPLILALSFVSDFKTAALAMGLIGICGGFFIVPLNALLQRRGHVSVGAGNALAIQNFAENSAMLLFVAVYSSMNALGVSINHIVAGFGTVMLVATLVIRRLRTED
ncbi:MAG: lysophospholipid transporter LplT [Candidatus Accumulibacter sp.]|jgi:LPLT family lysophospholipid transporter-like MFS transporter|nr:lysophospholipid transporter LplT [Accumulibacter sp.]